MTVVEARGLEAKDADGKNFSFVLLFCCMVQLDLAVGGTRTAAKKGCVFIAF